MLAGKMNDPELVAWVKDIARAACKADFGRLRSKLEALELSGMRGDPQVGIDILEVKKTLEDYISKTEDEKARAREEAARGRIIGGGPGYADTPGHRTARAHEQLELVRSTGKVKIKLDGGLQIGAAEPFASITSTGIGHSTPGILRSERVAEVVPLPRRRLTLRDLLPSRTIENPTAEWIRETSSPSAAMQSAEGSPKMATSMEFSIASARAETLAAWLTASAQVLDDWDELRRVIDASLVYRLKLVEEEQLLSGDGTGTNLNGLMTQATQYQGTFAAGTDNKADTLRRALLELETANEEPDFIVVNPIDWTDIQLSKSETEGVYLLQSPLGIMAAPVLWSRPVVATNSIAPGLFLVGDSRMATVFDRMEANVQISSEHEDYFTRNLVAIRVEERLALGVLRTTSFVVGEFQASP